jgi:hypothetical protein
MATIMTMTPDDGHPHLPRIALAPRRSDTRPVTLVIERGWTTDRYENWLANALITQMVSQEHQGM